MYHEGRWFTWFIGDLFGQLRSLNGRNPSEKLSKLGSKTIFKKSKLIIIHPCLFLYILGGAILSLYLLFITPNIIAQKSEFDHISNGSWGRFQYPLEDLGWHPWGYPIIKDHLRRSSIFWLGKKWYLKRWQYFVLFWVQRKTSTNLNIQNSVLKLKLFAIFDAFFVEILGMIPTGCVF